MSERHNYVAMATSPKLSDDASEEEKLRKLYDQARVQGNKKKKKEYKEKIAELNRLRKSAQRENNRSKS
jgi:CRISPR/Cas system CSM-associated protein Csm2 small subunit